MKIEKINENQIRCFITMEDLAARQMKISELAYGTEKAKTLFREMMRFASAEYGFEPDDLPLMIEAIPLSQETILLTVTKVAFPDELDSRFAYFSDSEIASSLAAYTPGFGLPDHYVDSLGSAPAATASDIIQVIADGDEEFTTLLRHFVFKSMDTIISVAKVLNGMYSAPNSLYKDNAGFFHLILSIGTHTPEVFNKVCNRLSEYGVMEDPSVKSYTKITEHAKLISKDTALQDLAKL